VAINREDTMPTNDFPSIFEPNPEGYKYRYDVEVILGMTDRVCFSVYSYIEVPDETFEILRLKFNAVNIHAFAKEWDHTIKAYNSRRSHYVSRRDDGSVYKSHSYV
jgi:hypothetical protein